MAEAKQFSPNSLRILQARYFLKNERNEVLDKGPADLFWRVAEFIASAERVKKERQKWAQTFFEVMMDRDFLPNSPTLTGAGRSMCLSACFVLPLEDSMESIFSTVKNTAMVPQAEFLLFSASRAQLVRDILRPALKAGRTVVLDRFYDSSLAYQGYGHQLDLDTLRTITRFATGGLIPDLTLLLDLPAELGLNRKRREGEWNRLDAYDLAFHERVRQGYHVLAAAEPARWIAVDASRSVEDVQADVRRVVVERIGLER